MLKVPFFRNASLAVPLFAAGVFAASVQLSFLTKPAVPVMPNIYDGQVCIQDFTQNSYHLNIVSMSGTITELRNNMSTYLYPLAWGGTHAAWIGSERGSGGGGGRATYYVQTIAAANKAERKIVEGIYYIEQVTAAANRVVWTDYRHFTTTDTTIEIYMYDMIGSAERRITTQRGYKASPSIFGNSIVWQDYRNAASVKQNADIYFYDLAASQERAVCTNSSYQDQPDVYNSVVVWQDFRNTGSDSKNADIYLRDMSGSTELAVCTAPRYQAYPRIYGQFVVWQDFRNASPQDTGNADIYMYDIASHTERAVVTKAGYQAEPYLYGTTVVWFDHTDNSVYKAELSATSIHAERVAHYAPAATKTRLSHRINEAYVPLKDGAKDLLGRIRSGAVMTPGAGVYLER
jgi:beta propeller repeat protein